MDTKTTSWVSYITIVGWLVAFFAGDKEGAKFHLNQSLIIWIGAAGLSITSFIFAFVPIIRWFVFLAVWAAYIFLVVTWIIGLIAAINQEEKEIPLIGQIRILK